MAIDRLAIQEALLSFEYDSGTGLQKKDILELCPTLDEGKKMLDLLLTHLVNELITFNGSVGATGKPIDRKQFVVYLDKLTQPAGASPAWNNAISTVKTAITNGHFQ